MEKMQGWGTGRPTSGDDEQVPPFARFLQEMRQRQKSLGKQAEALLAGERLLVRQRFQFPPSWPQTSMVESAYADFETILGRRCFFVFPVPL